MGEKLSDINSFVVVVVDELRPDEKYQNVTGYKEWGRIFFIDPKTYQVQYVLKAEGWRSPDRVVVRKRQDKTISSAISTVAYLIDEEN